MLISISSTDDIVETLQGMAEPLGMTVEFDGGEYRVMKDGQVMTQAPMTQGYKIAEWFVDLAKSLVADSAKNRVTMVQ